jgi:predicted kinase
MKKSLILLRGVPGSGKTSLAEVLSENKKYPIFSIDSYFTDAESGEYKFDYTKNYLAYANCEKLTADAMQQSVEKIIVDNTFVFEWEMEPYFKLAKQFDYSLFSLVVENYHGNKNTHHISEEDVIKMAAKLKVKLY